MHLILTLERAGAQEVVRLLARHLHSEEVRIRVCTFEDGPVRHDLEILGIPVDVLGPRRHGIEAFPFFVLEMLRIRKRLARIIERHTIHILQTHLLQTLDFLTLTLRPEVLLWTLHNVDFLPAGRRGWSRLKRRVHALLYRTLIRKTKGFVAVSEEVEQAVVRRLGPLRDRITTIPNGVDIDRYVGGGDREALCDELGIPASSKLVLTAGRLTEQKGHRYLLDAWSGISRSLPDAHLLLAGDGELRADLEARARAGAGMRTVHVLGMREDIPRLLAACDLFVLPSLWEGLSIALLEAMAAARPIVATEVSGTTQALRDGRSGRIVPPRDVEALAKAVKDLLIDPDRARPLGEAARETVRRRFSAERQAKAYLDLYSTLLASSRKDR